MRKLVVSEFVSLDGVMEAPGGDDGYVHGAWTIPFWCDDIGAFKTAELFAADALLVGRRTYQGFAAAWPERTGDPFSDHMNAVEHVVVSSTLTDAQLTWRNTTIIRDEMVTAIGELKRRDGADILVAGSATLVQALLVADLVDELRLEVYPLTLGTGKRLFTAETRLDFSLIDSTQASSGVMLLTYRRGAPAPSTGEFPYERRLQ